MHPQKPLYRHERANMAALKQRFPQQFSGPDPYWNYSCPDGWYSLVERVCRTAHERQLPVVWVQIKEKFGGLRMYRAGQAPRIDFISEDGIASVRPDTAEAVGLLIREAEEESYRTCMRCGRAGTRRVVGSVVVTLCDKHHKLYVRAHRAHKP